MQVVKRWVPFVASVVVVATEILRAIGLAGIADYLATGLNVVLGFLGLTGVTPDQALVTAAVTSAVGLFLQLKSRWDKARNPQV